MNKTILKMLMVFCLIATISSCKTKGIEEKAVDECELFKIKNYKFYNPRVYERPIIFKKGSHDLMSSDFTPIWYPGYCAVNLPSYFETKDDFIKYVHSKEVDRRSRPYYEQFYEVNKKNENGLKAIYHDDYHLLFRGTVSVKNVNSGNEYLLVAGKNYIATEADYDKNTEFYEKGVKTMFAFLLEDGAYKLVDIDLVVGTFSKQQHELVYDILNVNTLVDAICFESVNTTKKSDFDKSTLPGWVYKKAESK